MLNRVCGMRLSTFGVVLGWLGIVASLLLLTAFTTTGAYAEFQRIPMDQKNFAQVFTISVAITWVVLHLMSSALLVYGIVNDRHLLLLPWLINCGLALGISTPFKIYGFGILISSLGMNMIPALFLALLLIVEYHIYYAILSLFKQIRANNEQRGQPDYFKF